MVPLIWTGPALEDVRGIAIHIASDSPTYATRFAQRLLTSARRLVRFPDSGGIVPEIGDRSIREVLCGSYRVLYEIRGETCYVVAVIHGSRDLLAHLDPLDWSERR